MNFAFYNPAAAVGFWFQIRYMVGFSGLMGCKVMEGCTCIWKYFLQVLLR